jgi:DNA-binding CsgD family transcriptional regulator
VHEYRVLPWHKINNYLLEISGACNVKQFLHLALINIGKLIPFDQCGILGCLHNPERVFFQETFRGCQSSIEFFRQYYHRVMPDVRRKALQCIEVDWHEYQHTEFVMDFIHPNNIRYSAGLMNIRYCDELSLYLNRSKDLPRFSQIDMNILNIVQGHLANYCTMLSETNPAMQYLEATDIRSVFSALTRREAEIAALLYRKLSTELISSSLKISPLTVYKHIENIYTKMKINNRKDLLVKLVGINNTDN